MSRGISPTLLEILHTTLSVLERDLGLPQNDPGLVNLKRSLVRAIGEIEERTVPAKIIHREPPDLL